MRPLACIIICFLSLASVFAQDAKPPKPKRQNFYFLKNDGRYVAVVDSADYVRIVSEPDSGSTLYNVDEYYKNGKRKLLGKTSKIEYLSLEGQSLSFYPDGNKRSVETSKAGKLNGPCYYFYPNGKIYCIKDFFEEKANGNPVGGDNDVNYRLTDCLDSAGKVLAINGNGHYVGYDSKFKYIEEEGPVKDGLRDSIWTGADHSLKLQMVEQYDRGQMISGTSTDSTGVKHSYKAQFVSAGFAGGFKAFGRYLSSHIVYPKNARQNGIQGTVIVTFVIKKDGQLKDIKVMKHVDDELDQEAVRVLSRSSGWQPGLRYGLPVNVAYSIPVAFVLAN